MSALRTLVGASLGIVAVAIGAYLLWPLNAPKRRGRTALTETSDDAPSAASSVAAPPASRVSDAGGPALDRAKADAMREKIRALLAEAGPPWGAGDDPPSAAPQAPRGVHRKPDGTYAEMPDDGDGGSELRTAYIQSRLRDDVMPLAKQCYTTELERDPRLAGKVAVQFTIVGDRRVGGVVDSVSVGEGSTLTGKHFVDCITESLMSVGFDAPPAGGTLSVSYAMRFSPEEPDAGADG